ncbi:MAG: YbjQ family protein [Gammaproteobacteria bacterium]
MYELIFVLGLLLVGYIFGGIAEKRHYRSILQREAALRDLPVIASPFPTVANVTHGELVTGSVVISIDYFKRFLAGLRNLIGGRVSAYETLVDRGRREAILRMKEQAHAMGARYVFNIKLETSRVYQNTNDGGTGSIEILAYGTALVVRD